MNFVSVRQAAEALKVDVSWINKLISRGKIQATMVGTQYIILASEVENYASSKRPVGRPRKVQNA